MVLPLLAVGAMAAASAAATYYGAQQTNAQNRAINSGQMVYQSGREDLAHARQVDLNREAQAYNTEEAYRARDWSAEMSNTAYQRSRRDMLAAGLNPILMAGQGGASTPTASLASTQAGTARANAAPAQHRMENALGPAVSSGLQAANTMAGIAEAGSRMDLQSAQATASKASAAQAVSQTALNNATAVTEAQRAGLVKAQTASELVMPSLRQAQTTATSAQGVLAREQAATEPDRRSTLRETGRRESEVANRNREETRQLEQYGRPRDPLSQVGQSIVNTPQRSEWIRDTIRDRVVPNIR